MKLKHPCSARESAALNDWFLSGLLKEQRPLNICWPPTHIHTHTRAENGQILLWWTLKLAHWKWAWPDFPLQKLGASQLVKVCSKSLITWEMQLIKGEHEQRKCKIKLSTMWLHFGMLLIHCVRLQLNVQSESESKTSWGMWSFNWRSSGKLWRPISH